MTRRVTVKLLLPDAGVKRHHTALLGDGKPIRREWGWPIARDYMIVRKSDMEIILRRADMLKDVCE